MFDRIRRFFRRQPQPPQQQEIPVVQDDFGIEQAIRRARQREQRQREGRPQQGGRPHTGPRVGDSGASGGALPRFRKGGRIASKSPIGKIRTKRRSECYRPYRGPYKDKDVVKAILAPGELVLPRRITEKLAKLINTKVVLSAKK